MRSSNHHFDKLTPVTKGQKTNIILSKKNINSIKGIAANNPKSLIVLCRNKLLMQQLKANQQLQK